MFLSNDTHSGFPIHKNNSYEQKKKSKLTSHSLFNASAVCSNTTSDLYCHHPGVDSAWVQVRPEQHTLISVFKLNSFIPCQFQHSRARKHEWELVRAMRRSVCVLIRSAQNRVSERVQIVSSHSSLVPE